jgi:aerobic carbon-monoxide dehydrogenase small subunit
MTAAVREISVEVNGTAFRGPVEHRLTLADLLRDRLGLTGTHVGCEQGVCGACTVLVDGRAVRACLMLAVQADGACVDTVEGLASGDALHPLQEAFWKHHALQCGFCTPGMLMSLAELLGEVESPCEHEVRAALSGNLCRCTGYRNIVRAVLEATGGGA